jgi:hypothetical protein
MTADNIFDIVIPLMFSETDEKADYETDFIATLNLLVADLFEANNSILAAAGETELEDIPEITALTDTMTYAPKLCRVALPFGIAGQMMMEDNPNIATQYKNKYEYEKQMAGKAVYVQTDNYYGDLAEDE